MGICMAKACRGIHSTLRSGRVAFASALGAFALLLGAPSGVWAVGLGPGSLHSALGEPLRFSLPVTRQEGEDVGCVQVTSQGGDLPSVPNTRASVVRIRGSTLVEISSARPVDEPAIGVVVSVGCTSPVARDYVFFLDPPVIPTLAAAATVASQAGAPSRSKERPAPVRGATSHGAAKSRHRAVSRTGAAAHATSRRAAAPHEAAGARPRTRPSRMARQVARHRPSKAVAAVAPKPVMRDRLTVAPTEPSRARPDTGVEPAPAIAAAPSGAVTAAPSAASSGMSAPPTDAGTVSPDVAGAAMSREEELRRQQAELQQQVKALTDQINALRMQTTALSARNEALEGAVFPPSLVWLLIALAAIAIAVAGWMALRYTQLRRSVEGSAWWSANTVQAPTSGAAATKATIEPHAAASGGDAHLPVSSVEARAPAAVSAAAATASASNLQDRRPAVRSARYAAAIDTDFTVSDIEAAMATVRTVSPPRAAAPDPLHETDFAALGGPTLPSPFADPPPAARPQSTGNAPGGAMREERPAIRASRGDVDRPPVTASRSVAPATTPPAGPVEETMPLDFKLDIPAQYDDPLATNSMKTTIVDRPEPVSAVDFELPSTPTPLDFELPSASVVSPLTAPDDDRSSGTTVRHAATALDDIFPPLGSPGVDTILNLDEQDGAPLITTEVDNPTTAEMEGTQREERLASTRSRLVRFVDLMHQVDEASQVDPLRAIAMLRQYVLRDEQIPTLLWLRLFALYKQVDKKPVYEALAEHFARRYGRTMTGWNESLSDRVPQIPLSAIDEIDRNLAARWGSEEGMEYLRSLLCDRNQPDAIVFNAVLQRDLLDAVKAFPLADNSLTDPDGGVDTGLRRSC